MTDGVLITNIQRFSVNDGPGIRTTVFLKGCPLHCYWCQNPECIHPYEEFYYIEKKCSKCGRCAEICPENAITLPGQNGEPPIRDREKCNRCMECVDECPNGALERVGRLYTIDEVMKEVESDMDFYRNSGGGMTVSGGEPLFYPESTLELLRRAKKSGIHTCIDTTAYAHWEVVEEILNYTDLVLLDNKSMDPEAHRKATGVSNELISDNARKMAEWATRLWIRLPIIPNFNDDEEHIEKVAKFAKELGESVEEINILPFHNFAEGKYDQLDRSYILKGEPSMVREEVEDFKEIFEGYGFKTAIG